ncbi:E3 ubiquitin-protein ligase [Balamuthia mandrillaris]
MFKQVWKKKEVRKEERSADKLQKTQRRKERGPVVEPATLLGPFEVLPLELLSYVVELHGDDVHYLLALSSLNSEWRALVDTPRTWKRVFASRFPSHCESIAWVVSNGLWRDKSRKATTTTTTTTTTQSFPWKEQLKATSRCPFASRYQCKEVALPHLNDAYKYYSFRGSVGVSGQAAGRWYFEVEVLRTNGHPNMQLGWLTNAFTVNLAQHYGVGDDAFSWGYDGFRKSLYYKSKGATGYSHPWKNGDRVGCCLDLDNSTISYFINGKSLGVAFRKVKASAGEFFYPGVTYYGGYFPTIIPNDVQPSASGQQHNVSIGVHFIFEPDHFKYGLPQGCLPLSHLAADPQQIRILYCAS